MAKQHPIEWHEVDKPISGLETDVEHEIPVKREAIPLVFIPGIMGSRLRRAGTNGSGNGEGGLPNLRWDPGDGGYMWDHYVGAEPAARRSMIIGRPDQDFDSGYLEVDEATPPGDGFRGVMGFNAKGKIKDYLVFLNALRTHAWGDLNKIFEFPVYAAGYNWCDNPKNAGAKLAKRIEDIIAEAKAVTGICEKVILITHSMGGIVARAASELCGAQSSILGIIHGVQPVTGAPAGYWRVKAGFEGSDSLGFLQKALGNNGPKVTCILGNIPGGLALLPNKLHDRKPWLTVTENNAAIVSLPASDPYQEIYRVKAVVEPADEKTPASNNAYWGLIDEALLNPGGRAPSGGNANDALDAAAMPAASAWNQYLKVLGVAEAFHDELGVQQHPHTLCLRGTGQATADVIEMRVESWWVKRSSYPNQGFRGYFVDAAGNKKLAVLQDPVLGAHGAGNGDSTVVLSSASKLDTPGRPAPGDHPENVKHQPAFENGAVQQWAIQAVTTLAKLRYYEKHGTQLGDFPAQPASAGHG